MKKYSKPELITTDKIENVALASGEGSIVECKKKRNPYSYSDCSECNTCDNKYKIWLLFYSTYWCKGKDGIPYNGI